MKWHLVTGDFAPTFSGGVAVWNERLADALVGGGASVQVWARGHRQRRAEEAAWDAQAPFPVTRVRARSWNTRGGKAAAKALRACVGAGDLVVASTWPMAVDLPQVCAKVGASLIVVGHGSEISRLQSDTPLPLKRLLEARIHWATVSKFLARPLEARGAQVTVLPAPVDVGENAPAPSSHADLLVVARLTPLKGVERAIRLAAAMSRPLRVIGEGVARERLVEEAAVCGIEVRFDGRQPQSVVAAAYSESAALLALSRTDANGVGAEGFGLAVVEASARGVPVVVSDVGGLREAAGPGLVLTSPDDVEGSAAQIEAYLSDDQAGPRQRAHVAQRHGAARLIASLAGMVG